MLKHRNKLVDDTCWVYVQLNDEHVYIVGITYDEEFRKREISSGRPPLLWRRFDDTFSAAGYRIILKNMPVASLEKVLKECKEEDENQDKAAH